MEWQYKRPRTKPGPFRVGESGPGADFKQKGQTTL
jgi:hypothetical protein